MKQTKQKSFVESTIQTIIGLGTSILIQVVLVSYEFTETVSHVFENELTLFFVFKKGITKETNANQITHIKEYYKKWGYKKFKFLTQ